MVNEIRGTSLFNDVEDRDLRIRNRAVIMANELESGHYRGKLHPRSVAFLWEYFDHIPAGEKKETQAKFIEFARERGFVIQH